MLDAAAFILEQTDRRSQAEYREDRLLRNAVERNFEIIGEAMGRLARDAPEVASRISSHRDIIAFRNLLAHGYDAIDHEQVWHVIERDLPCLRDEVRALLEESE